MSEEPDTKARLERLREAYADLGGPTADQWERLASVPEDRPLVLTNLFAFRDTADYGDADETPVTGREAFDRYAAVSAPALDEVGGRFLHVGSHHLNLMGEDQVWDLIVVGEYPNLAALIALHENEAYRDAYRHRVAACDRQTVLISG